MKQENETAAKRSPVYGIADGYMGDLVAWKFGEFAAPRKQIVDIFQAAGFGDFFEHDLSIPARALGQAFRSGISYGRALVAKPMPKKNKDTSFAVGVYERVAKQGESGDDWPCGARVRIDANDRAVALAPEGAPGREPCMKIAQEIATNANELMTTVKNIELSNAIVWAGRNCMWAPFRASGGVYWVTASRAHRLRSLFDQLERTGEFWATVQPLFADEEGRTVRNVGEAATSSIQNEIAMLTKELEAAQAGKLGERAIESRMGDCHELVLRAELYGSALAGKLDSIREAIADMRTKFGNAIGNLDAHDSKLDFSEFAADGTVSQ